jgi:hypothetical protein
MTYTGSTGTPVVGQTVTGGTSLKTAVITRLFSGYLVVRTLSGTFTNGETITIGGGTPTFSATLGTVADYKNEQGSPEYYWKDDQTSVACRFYYGGKGGNAVLSETGTMSLKPLSVMLPSTVTIADRNYRIVTTTTGMAGTYELTLFPKVGAAAIHHYEAVLTKVQTP